MLSSPVRELLAWICALGLLFLLVEAILYPGKRRAHLLDVLRRVIGR
jgi:hypothetical protein